MSRLRPLVAATVAAAALRAGAASPEGCRPCPRACEQVMERGRGGPGAVGLADVVDLNMRGWKPQSSHGIEILGWSAAPGAPGRCVVSYTYRDGAEVVLAWEFVLEDGSVRPLSPLADRIQRMTDLLGSYLSRAARRAASGSSPEQSDDVITKASKP